MVYQLGDRRRACNRRNPHLSRFLLLGAAIWAAPQSLAAAAEPEAVSGTGSAYLSQQPLAREELDALRGRLLVEGWDIALGLNIASLVDGLLIQQVNMELDDSGRLVTTSFVAADPLPAGVSILVNGQLVHGPAPTSASLASLPADPSGVIVSTGDGFSAILHVIGGGHTGNILVNDAVGRTLSQNMTVEITIGNFSSLMPELQTTSLANTLNHAVNLGIVGSLP